MASSGPRKVVLKTRGDFGRPVDHRRLVRLQILAAAALFATPFLVFFTLSFVPDVELHFAILLSAIAVSTGLSVGYVIWLIRGGVLLSSVLSSLPAWRLVDPLPVLAYTRTTPEGEPEDGESLQSLVKKKASGPDNQSVEENTE